MFREGAICFAIEFAHLILRHPNRIMPKNNIWHRCVRGWVDVDFEKKLELDRKLGVDEVLQNANFIVKNDSSLEHLYKSWSLVINQIESNFLPLSHEDILLNLFDDTLRDHRDWSIVSDIDLFEIWHRLSNLSNNDIVDLLIDVRQKSNSLELSKLTKHQALACARDLWLIMALITKIKNYDRVEVNYDYAFLGDLLVSLSKITQEVPRETVYSYWPRNNGVHKAKRTFTNLKEEEIFIDNFSIAIEWFYKVIWELLWFRKYILEDQWWTYLNNAIKEFWPAIQWIVNIRKLISPEVFTHQMRPYFDSYEVWWIRYDAPWWSQMPLIIIDLIIRWWLSADESFNKFVDRNIEYYPSALKL